MWCLGALEFSTIPTLHTTPAYTTILHQLEDLPILTEEICFLSHLYFSSEPFQHPLHLELTSRGYAGVV